MKDVSSIIEKKLNTDLTKLEKYQIDNLNEIPYEHIENARKLQNEYEAEHYLSLIVSNDNARYLKDFIMDVIINQEDWQDWRKRAVIFVLDASIQEILTKPRKALFGFPDSHFKYIIKPDYKYLETKASDGGVLTFVNPNANYKTRAPYGYIMSSLNVTQLLEIEQDRISFHFRRWVASRIAAYLDYFNKLKGEFDSSILEEVAHKKEWTEDTLKALRGLQKERENYKWKETDIPGFCGQDSYYE